MLSDLSLALLGEGFKRKLRFISLWWWGYFWWIRKLESSFSVTSSVMPALNNVPLAEITSLLLWWPSSWKEESFLISRYGEQFCRSFLDRSYKINYICFIPQILLWGVLLNCIFPQLFESRNVDNDSQEYYKMKSISQIYLCSLEKELSISRWKLQHCTVYGWPFFKSSIFFSGISGLQMNFKWGNRVVMDWKCLP